MMSISKSSISRFVLLVVCFGVATLSADTPEEIDGRVTHSRQVVGLFADALVAELKWALEHGDPADAVKVCHVVAPELAKDLSDQYHWDIGRTSLKTRNPNNNPDAWERDVLNTFEKRKREGESIAGLEYYEETKDGFRYMKAIPTKGLCLTCHGDNIPPEVQAKLDKYYPEDKATGFQVGDIRGAFTLIQRQ
jgi:hypothetical protein